MGIEHAKLEYFESFHQPEERGKGYAMVIKHITSGKLEDTIILGFKFMIKLTCRYEETILEVFP